MKTTLIILSLLCISNLATAQQVCNTEAEVPSTTPDSRFTDNGDGTISDTSTNLMWQKCQIGLSEDDCSVGSDVLHTWFEALTEASTNTLAGYDDWRLPNHKELLSIVEQRCVAPAINTTYFPNTTSDNFRTSTPTMSLPSYTHNVHFNDGITSSSSREFNDFYVRLVRYGQ